MFSWIAAVFCWSVELSGEGGTWTGSPDGPHRRRALAQMSEGQGWQGEVNPRAGWHLALRPLPAWMVVSFRRGLSLALIRIYFTLLGFVMDALPEVVRGVSQPRGPHTTVALSSLFSCSVVSDSLQPYQQQHARPPCPSPSPGAYSNPCPSSR